MAETKKLSLTITPQGGGQNYVIEGTAANMVMWIFEHATALNTTRGTAVLVIDHSEDGKINPKLNLATLISS